MALNINDILTAYGSYYLGNKENRQRLYSLLYRKSDAVNLFQAVPMASGATTYRTAKSFMDRIVQRFQKAYTPIGTVTFKPHEIPLSRLKVDMEEAPDDLYESWLGFLTRLANTSNTSIDNLMRTTWPFVRWLIEEHVIPKIQEDMEMNEYYWGDSAAPIVSGTPTSIGTSIDGLALTLANMQTNSIGHLLPMGVVSATAASFVEQIEDFVDAAVLTAPQYARMQMEICMNNANYMKYRRGFRDLYGKDTDQLNLTSNSMGVIDRPGFTVVPCSFMDNDPANPGTSAERVFMTFAQNRIRPILFGTNKNIFDVVKAPNPRCVQIYTDWDEAIGFNLEDAVFYTENI